SFDKRDQVLPRPGRFQHSGVGSHRPAHPGEGRRRPLARVGPRLRYRRGGLFGAMLLLEQQTTAPSPCRLQIFATDVDEQALEVARQGIYPEGLAADVSPERLARFFTRVDESAWQISKQVRETVTFAVQNLIADAPFSKMDLISCRNLLIYLEPEVQKKVITLLHFALKEGGYLFLGPSETV